MKRGPRREDRRAEALLCFTRPASAVTIASCLKEASQELDSAILTTIYGEEDWHQGSGVLEPAS